MCLKAVPEFHQIILSNDWSDSENWQERAYLKRVYDADIQHQLQVLGRKILVDLPDIFYFKIPVAAPL